MSLSNVSPRSLPSFWQLDEVWLERLGASARDQRHYLCLSELERRKLDSDWQLLTYYYDADLQEYNKTPEGFIRRMASELDRLWLRAGKGRAVDFKGALRVLQAYGQYQNWFKSLPRRVFLVDLVIPYLWEGISRGFCSLRVTLEEPLVGKLGEVVWEKGSIDIDEIEPDDHSEDQFCLDPFRFFPSPIKRRKEGSGITWKLSQFLYRANYPMCRHSPSISLPASSGEEMRSTTIFRCGNGYVDPNYARIGIKEVNASQMQTFFDKLVVHVSPLIVPRDQGELRFEVADDLTTVKVFQPWQVDPPIPALQQMVERSKMIVESSQTITT
jgi:hypothetical protein